MPARRTFIASLVAIAAACGSPTVRDQARWVANDVRDLSNPAALDDYMFGSLAATPQVAGVAIITPDGNSRG